MGFNIGNTIGSALRGNLDEGQQPEHVSFGQAVLQAADADGIHHEGGGTGGLQAAADGQPPEHLSFGQAVLQTANANRAQQGGAPSGPHALTLDDLPHATLDQLKNADIPALIEEAKQRIGDIDIRGLTLANVDRLPIPDVAKEAIKFLLDPKGYIEKAISDRAQKIQDSLPPGVKKFLEISHKIGEGMRAVGQFFTGIGHGIKDAIATTGHMIGQLGSAIGGAASSAGSAIVDAGKSVLHFFGF